MQDSAGSPGSGGATPYQRRGFPGHPALWRAPRELLGDWSTIGDDVTREGKAGRPVRAEPHLFELQRLQFGEDVTDKNISLEAQRDPIVVIREPSAPTLEHFV